MGSIRPAVYFSQWSFIRNTAHARSTHTVPGCFELQQQSWATVTETTWPLRSWKSLLSELYWKILQTPVLDSNVRPVLQMLFLTKVKRNAKQCENAYILYILHVFRKNSSSLKPSGHKDSPDFLKREYFCILSPSLLLSEAEDTGPGLNFFEEISPSFQAVGFGFC